MKKILILSVMAVALLTACEKPVVIDPNGNNNKTDIKYTELNLKNLFELMGLTKDSTKQILANYSITEANDIFTALTIKTEGKEYATMYEHKDCNIVLIMDSTERVSTIRVRSETLQRTFIDTEVNTVFAGKITNVLEWSDVEKTYIIQNKYQISNGPNSYNEQTHIESGCLFGIHKY